MRCDVIAEGIIEAAKELQLVTPIVVRLQVKSVSLPRPSVSCHSSKGTLLRKLKGVILGL